MPPSSCYRNRIVILFVGLFFILACSLGGTTTAQPVFDTTKAVLELEATAMVLQLTQSAMNNQAPAAAPTVAPLQPTVAPPPTAGAAPTASSGMSQDFDTWMKSASILLFEDMAGDFVVGRSINEALNGLGLSYTDVKDALGHYKNEILSGGPGGRGWDLIISGKELRSGVQGEFYVYLNDAITQGSAVIIEEWDMDAIGYGKLSLITGRCGVTLDKDWIGKPVSDHVIFPIDGTHPIHHMPNEGIALTNPTGYWVGDDLGDRMRLAPGSKAIPLWGLYANSKNNDLTAVTCVDGRVIIQTYSTHSYGDDRVVRMWQNYIYNTLKARYDYLAAQ